MNVTNLKENHQLLLSYMSEKGYKESTISCYRRQIQWIIDNAENRAWTSYKDIYLEYASCGYSYNWLRGKKALLGTLERFDLYGEYPDGKHHFPFFAKKAYDFLLPDFKRVIDFYEDAGKKPNCRHPHLETGHVLPPDFSITCRIKAVVPWLMSRKKWYRHFLLRMQTAHGAMIIYSGSGPC